jgi:hypothetical protein
LSTHPMIYLHNKSLKFVPRFALHRTRLTPRRLA